MCYSCFQHTQPHMLLTLHLQTCPFWPVTDSMRMFVRYETSTHCSIHFNINENHRTVLRMDNGVSEMTWSWCWTLIRELCELLTFCAEKPLLRQVVSPPKAWVRIGFNSLASGRHDCDLKCKNFKCNVGSISNKHYPLMNARGPCSWYVNIGSGNGLVPSGNKPLSEPMLTEDLQRYMASL